jgi:5-methylcytosine-specific restriction endonuclease McrA
VTLWCQGKVEVISVYDREIRAVSFSFKLPSVIRLLRYIKIKRRFDYVPFSRANIYARDEHSCQYCGDEYPDERAHLRPCGAGRQGRPEGLGKHRHVLRHVQPQERWAHAG